MVPGRQNALFIKHTEKYISSSTDFARLSGK